MRDLEFEVSNARIWGGIHYRSAVEAGVKIGKSRCDMVHPEYTLPARNGASRLRW